MASLNLCLSSTSLLARSPPPLTLHVIHSLSERFFEHVQCIRQLGIQPDPWTWTLKADCMEETCKRADSCFPESSMKPSYLLCILIHMTDYSFPSFLPIKYYLPPNSVSSHPILTIFLTDSMYFPWIAVFSPLLVLGQWTNAINFLITWFIIHHIYWTGKLAADVAW